jgi:hypothetical protein
MFQPFQPFNRCAPFKSLKLTESPTVLGQSIIKVLGLRPHRHPAGEQCSYQAVAADDLLRCIRPHRVLIR